MTDVVYLPTPRKHVQTTDPRVNAAQNALGPINYVGPISAAVIIDAAVNLDIENGVHRAQLYPLMEQRHELTEALRNPGAVVKRYRFGKGVKETRQHWQIRAILAVLARQAGKL